MNKHLTIIFSCLAALAMVLGCGCNPDPSPTPDPDPVPTSITLSAYTFDVSEAGETLSLTVEAPARPTVTGLPSWIKLVEGTYNKYKITYGLNVAANPDYETRSATLTVTATGASAVTLTVNQAAAEKQVTPTPPEPGEADGLASLFGLGWNMGNQFDAYYNGSWAGAKEGYPDETCWMPEPHSDYMATQATFDGVKAKGFGSVRIPISWLNMIGPAPDYKIDQTWMNRVYEVVGFAHKAGLKVIINTHHDENHGVSNTYQWLDIKNAANNSELNETIKKKITAVWTQIANKFADCGEDWLMMEGFNELNDGGWGWSSDFKNDPYKQCRILDQWNQVFVDAVRATGGINATRWLGVPSYCANPDFTKYMTLPTDPANKIAVSVHFYDPSDYTIGDAQYSDWGHTAAAGKKANGGDEDHVQAVFSKLYNTYVANGIPVYIGEFGCSMRAQSDSRAWAFYKYYMEYVVKAAKSYSLPCFLWDNGVDGYGKEKHGYIHHGNGSYIGNSKVILDIISKAWNNEASGYTLDAVYNTAPKF